MQNMVRVLIAIGILVAFPAMSLAQEGGQPAEGEDRTVVEVEEEVTEDIHGKITAGSGAAVGGACIGAGLAAIGGGYAIARVGGHCIDSMARQPEAAGSMFAPMIVTAAMIEGAMLFAIAVALLAVLRAI